LFLARNLIVRTSTLACKGREDFRFFRPRTKVTD
jgi:hypothetical protein